MDKKALRSLIYGMYVVSSKDGEKLNAQIANTVFQITSEPPVVAVSINKENLTHTYIEKSGVFGVSILSEEATFKLIGHFGFKSGKDIDKFSQIKYKTGKTGVPLLKDFTVSTLEAKVIGKFEFSTHTLFFGEIVDGKVLSSKPPMTYSYYHTVIKGKSPKKAPTYIEDKK